MIFRGRPRDVLETNICWLGKFRKSREYTVTGLSINQNLDSKVIAVTDTDRLETISHLIQKLVKEKKEPDLDLRVRNEETIEKVIRFQRKTPTEPLRLKFTFYNTSTKKNEEVEFYGYMSHVEKYNFAWEYTELAFKYSVKLSSDKSKLIKTFWMHKSTRRKSFLDEQRMWNVTLTDPNKPLENKFTVRSKMIGYFGDDFVPKASFGIRTETQVKNFKTITKGQKKYLHKISQQLVN